MRVTGTIFLIIVAACRSDVTAADTEDALAQDATLQLQVLEARGDTAPVIGEVDASIDLRPAVVESIASATRKTQSRAQEARAREARANTPAPIVVAPRTAAPATRVAAAPIAPPVTAPSVPDPEPRRTTLTVSSGTRLSVSAAERICVNSSRVGDRFVARVNQSVRGSGGIVI